MSQHKPENGDPLDQSINARPANPSESYRDGYVEGREENHLQQQEYNRAREQQIREENSGTNGVLLGLALTSLVALIFGTIFFLSQRNETPTQTDITIPEETEPLQESEPDVIERTVERTEEIVPVPQESSPPEVTPPPQVEINVPEPQLEPVPQPSAEPTPPAVINEQPQEAPVVEPPEPQEAPATADEMEQPNTETPPSEPATP